MKKPLIELSIQGEQTEEFIAWIREKFEVTIVTEAQESESVAVEETDFWKEMQSNRIGNLLVAARLKAGLTQKQLAKKVQIRQPMMSEYEQGKRRFTQAMGEKLSAALHIKASHLEC